MNVEDAEKVAGLIHKRAEIIKCRGYIYNNFVTSIILRSSGIGSFSIPSSLHTDVKNAILDHFNNTIANIDQELASY